MSVLRRHCKIGERQSNLQCWETTGKLPRSDLLVSLAQALGVGVEELLGGERPRRAPAPGGRLRQLFDAASRLPRRQQQKLIAVLEPFVSQHGKAA